VGTVNIGSRAPASLSFIWRCARGAHCHNNGRRPRSGCVSDRDSDPEIIPGDHIPTTFTLPKKDACALFHLPLNITRSVLPLLN
jgi:hypothetical protein